MSFLKSRGWRYAAMALGLWILISLCLKIGPEKILDELTLLGWRWVILLLLPASWYFLNSQAWGLCLGDEVPSTKRPPRARDLFFAKICGETVNTITPVSWAGGDPVRVLLIKKFTSGSQSAASVVVDRTVHFMAIGLMLILGLALAFFNLKLPTPWKWGSLISLTLIVGGTLFLWHHQKNGLLAMLFTWAKKIKPLAKKLAALEPSIRRTDLAIQTFYTTNHLRFFKVFLYHFLGRLLGVLEIQLIAAFLGHPVLFWQAMVLAVLTVLINMMFVLIPGSVGVMEGAFGGVFFLMNLDPAIGVAVQLVRRIRSVFWIGLGMVLLHFSFPKTTTEKMEKA